MPTSVNSLSSPETSRANTAPGGADRRPWSLRMAEAIIKRHPDSWTIEQRSQRPPPANRPPATPKWSYSGAYLLRAIFEVGLQNGGMASGLAGAMGKLGTLGLAAAIFSPWMNVSGSVLANYWRKKPVADTVTRQLTDQQPA